MYPTNLTRKDQKFKQKLDFWQNAYAQCKKYTNAINAVRQFTNDIYDLALLFFLFAVKTVIYLFTMKPKLESQPKLLKKGCFLFFLFQQTNQLNSVDPLIFNSFTFLLQQIWVSCITLQYTKHYIQGDCTLNTVYMWLRKHRAYSEVWSLISW